MSTDSWMNLDTNIKNVLIDYSFEIKKDKSSTKKLVIFVRVKDKIQTQLDIEKKLKTKKFIFSRQKISALSGSTECTVIEYNKTYQDGKIILVYKPASGGMQETTLNSTITELAPALAFVNGFKPKNVTEFYNFLKSIDHKTSSVYVIDRDREAGKNFVNQFPSSSKYEIKMKNAMGVLSYLQKEHQIKPIKNVYWGYRAKPQGIDNNHKGDLFIKYQDNKMIGVSLKAGGEKTAEPKLNTYVNKIMEQLTTKSDIDELRTKLFKEVYIKLGCTDASNYDKSKKKETIQILEHLEKSDLKHYDNMYDIGLNIIRNSLIDLFKKDLKKTLSWVNSAIIGESTDVPLVLVKAYEDKYQILNEEDDIHAFLPKVSKINAYISTTSKQDFFLELVDSKQTHKLKLKFSVRTNKTGSEHKLGQFYNLAVKFTGLVQ